LEWGQTDLFDLFDAFPFLSKPSLPIFAWLLLLTPLGRLDPPYAVRALSSPSQDNSIDIKKKGYLGVMMHLSGVFHPKTQLIDALIESQPDFAYGNHLEHSEVPYG